MTESEYKVKQRILIGVFTVGTVIILAVFIFSMRARFARLEVSNPVDQLPEESFSEWSDIQNSINDLNRQLEEEAENESNTSDVENEQEVIVEDESEEELPPDINRFLE